MRLKNYLVQMKELKWLLHSFLTWLKIGKRNTIRNERNANLFSKQTQKLLHYSLIPPSPSWDYYMLKCTCKVTTILFDSIYSYVIILVLIFFNNCWQLANLSMIREWSLFAVAHGTSTVPTSKFMMLNVRSM